MERSREHVVDMSILRAAGLRATPQRVAVLAALRSRSGHVAAEEIARAVRDDLPSLNLATVYRALHDLRESGLIAETDMGEKTLRYELVRERHHHTVCVHCGGVADIEDDVLDPVKHALLERHGFHAQMDHFAIFGLCAQCAAAGVDEVAENQPG